MKDIKSYITEGKKYFTLDTDERDALAEFIGILSGNLGDDEDVNELKEVAATLSEEEMKQLDSLYDYLDDEQTYKKVTRNGILDDIPLITKIYNTMEEKDLLGERWDLIDAFEKICL